MLKYALLGFLNYRALTGYDLKRVMETSTANFWNADLSQIYRTLKTLESDSAIASHVEPQEERPDRRVYTIREAGRAELQAWLYTPLTEMPALKESLLLKVFFSGQVDKTALLTQLRLQRELHRQNLLVYQGRTLTDIQENAALMGASPTDALLWDATRRAGVLYEEMYLRWLDETITQIENT